MCLLFDSQAPHQWCVPACEKTSLDRYLTGIVTLNGAWKYSTAVDPFTAIRQPQRPIGAAWKKIPSGSVRHRMVTCCGKRRTRTDQYTAGRNGKPKPTKIQVQAARLDAPAVAFSVFQRAQHFFTQQFSKDGAAYRTLARLGDVRRAVPAAQHAQ